MYRNKIKYLVFICGILGLSSIFTGVSFSLFQADIKGTNVNKVSTSKVVFTYDEIENNSVSTIATDEYGMNSNDYVDFSLSASSSGTAKLDYYIYLTEKEGNTLDNQYVKVYLTDQDNVPIGDQFKDLENGIGKYCFDYNTNTLYTKDDDSFSNCTTTNLSLNDSKYIMGSKHINRTSHAASNICYKYTNINGIIEKEVSDISNCRYGDVYKGKANLVSFNDINTYPNSLTKVLFEGSFEFDKTNKNILDYRTYRLRCWTNEVDVPISETENEGTHTVESSELIYNFTINVFSKQVELGS